MVGRLALLTGFDYPWVQMLYSFPWASQLACRNIACCLGT